MARVIILLAVAVLGTGPAVAQMHRSGASYPPEAVRHHWQGVSHYALTIEADGRISDCQITRSSGHQVLDDETCSLLLERARFLPAHDADGKPVRSVKEGQIGWRLDN